MYVTKIIKVHGRAWGLQGRGDLGHPLPRYFIRGPRGLANGGLRVYPL